MKPNRVPGWMAAITILASVWASSMGVSQAQTYSSGSTGALGAFAPTANTTVTLPTDGVLHYTTVFIPAGVTVTFAKNAGNTPVMLLATGDVTVAGTINVNGRDGQGPYTNSATAVSLGGEGGPGGFRGGNGSSRDFSVPAAAGQGPGGGAAAPSTLNMCGTAGTYGVSGGSTSLVPLFGGSGGGGGATSTANGVPTYSGGSGGGGGGAVVIASSTKITLTGAVTANGGYGGCTTNTGSGGAIRLVASVVTGTGALSANSPPIYGYPNKPGRIRVEAFTHAFIGSSSPVASMAAAPGPVTAAGNPGLINLPSLAITSIGGVAVPASPTGAYTTADVALPTGTPNPVPVTLTAVNTPLSTTLALKLVPVAGPASTVPVSALSGTASLSTATASVTFPTGGTVSVLNAYASLTITAGLFPLIDGEEVDRVLMAATWGGSSTTTLVTASGRAVPVGELSLSDQRKVAWAFAVMGQME